MFFHRRFSKIVIIGQCCKSLKPLYITNAHVGYHQNEASNDTRVVSAACHKKRWVRLLECSILILSIPSK